MSRHTPGPWTADSKAAQFGRIAIKPAIGFAFGSENGEAIANARLMAAAPDLWEALERMLPYCRDGYYSTPEEHEEVIWRAAIERAEYALAKAKGETT